MKNEKKFLKLGKLIGVIFLVFFFLFSDTKIIFAGWTEQTGSGLRAWIGIASSSDGTKLVAVAEQTSNPGYIYTSTDSGNTWVERSGAGDYEWYAVASSSDGAKLAAVVNGGYIYTSDDSGVTWTEQTTSGLRNWATIASSSDGAKLVAGVGVSGSGYIYTSDDSGVTWTEQTTSGSRDWRGIASSSDGSKLVAGGRDTYIYTSTDSGATWSENVTHGIRIWTSVASSSDGVNLAITRSSNKIYTSIDSGVTWVSQALSPSSLWSSIASSSDGTKLAATVNNGYIYTSIDSGVNWTEETEAGSRYWYSIAASSDGTKLAGVNWGFGSGYIYTFPDITAPTISTLSPTDDAIDVAVDTNLVITFNEVVDVETGNITIYKSSDDSIVEAIDITSGQVTGTGTTAITINPTSNLENEISYYIQIDATAIDDTSSNSFAGITDETTWNFTTASAPSGGGGGGSSPDKACEDGLDNDGDLLVDYPEDPGCEDAKDRNEYNDPIVVIVYSCSDGIDNDNDGLIDFPNDLGCTSALDQDEFNVIIPPPIDPIEPPIETCATNPSLCIPPPPVETCATNPSLCPPPIDPCILNPFSCVTPPPIDPIEVDPPIEDCGDDCIVLPSDPINPNFDDPDYCPPGVVNSARCIIDDSLNFFNQNISSTTYQVKEIARSDYGNILIKTISITGLIFGTIFSVLPTLFANPLSFSEIALIPVRLWSMLMTLFGIKKKSRKWGVIYDSVTKQPLDPVYVTLQDVEGKELMSSITDIDGRYGFLVEPGKYRLLPKKTNYTFPSLKVVGKTRDEIYLDLYFGYVFEVTHSGEVISKNIPMDSVNFDWNEFAKKEKGLTKFYSRRDILFSKIADVVFSIGITLAFIALITAPVAYNIAIFILYLIVLVFREFGIRQKKSSKVMRKGSDIPLAYAIVRIFDTGTNIEIIHKITNRIGKFFALVRNGKYYVTIESKNEDGTYTKVYTSESIEVKDGIIDKVFEV